MRDKKLKSLKVLLVEDEVKIAQLLKSAIGDNFRSFLIANDGLEGLEMFEKISPDIIITDIMMPNKTGLEMAQKIRKVSKDIPIIILSAFSEKEKLFTAIDVGVTKYFTKPYDPDEILEYITFIAQDILQKVIVLKDGYSFNTNNTSLYLDSRYISLSKNEEKFIFLLIDSVDYKLEYEAIKIGIWGREIVSDERLRTFIKRLRAKTSKNFIQTLKGFAYKINGS